MGIKDCVPECLSDLGRIWTENIKNWKKSCYQCCQFTIFRMMIWRWRRRIRWYYSYKELIRNKSMQTWQKNVWMGGVWRHSLNQTNYHLWISAEFVGRKGQIILVEKKKSSFGTSSDSVMKYLILDVFSWCRYFKYFFKCSGCFGSRNFHFPILVVA